MFWLFVVLLSILSFFISCFKQNNSKNPDVPTDSLFTNSKKDIVSSVSPTINYVKQEGENEHDEFISNSLFENWKGIYKLKQEGQLDSWGRESISFSELTLIKPDSCIFKSWLSDEKGKRYEENDNYQEYIGEIYATPNKDSIEFYTKRVISGGNNSLSPLLTLTRIEENYFIYSLITSPPNNGVVKTTIIKL